MNQFSIRKIKNKFYGYEEDTCFIDDLSIQEMADDIAQKSKDEKVKGFGGFADLALAWTNEMDWKGDVRFISKLLDMDACVLPVLICPDDLDLSCSVVAVEVEKDGNCVYWKRIGYVNGLNDDYEEEKAKGILCTEAYSEEDWRKYGDNIALERVDSPAWIEWVEENWEEECFRRRMNYTLPYYKNGGVTWLKDLDWTFERSKYEEAITEYKKMINI